MSRPSKVAKAEIKAVELIEELYEAGKELIDVMKILEKADSPVAHDIAFTLNVYAPKQDLGAKMGAGSEVILEGMKVVAKKPCGGMGIDVKAGDLEDLMDFLKKKTR